MLLVLALGTERWSIAMFLWHLAILLVVVFFVFCIDINTYILETCVPYISVFLGP
jgi:hypothetical protein